MNRAARVFFCVFLLTPLAVSLAQGGGAAEAMTVAGGGALPWWGWVSLLFVVTFLLGIVAVLAGVGGGVLFVPIVGGFFPFHLDFVRGAGLLLALSGALSASPELLRGGMVNLRLTMPLALVASLAAIVGAMVGLALPVAFVQTALGIAILGIVLLLWLTKHADAPVGRRQDPLGRWLGIRGSYVEPSTGETVYWAARRTPLAMVLFLGVGFIGGVFGLGAGWANVPVLHLVMGVPLKVAVSSSVFLMSVVGTSAAWIYINRGAVMAIIAVPSVMGIMLGARVGVRLLKRLPASVVRKVVIVMLLLAGSRALLKGLGIWT